ncbi:AMP-binding protein [Myxococcus sp. 1LA]
MTLAGQLWLQAEQRPHAVAIREKQRGLWRELSFRDYLDRVGWVARVLWELGVRAGDSVAILSDNRPEWLFMDLGAQVLGARSVGIYQTNPAADAAHILNDARCRVSSARTRSSTTRSPPSRRRRPPSATSSSSKCAGCAAWRTLASNPGRTSWRGAACCWR